MADRVTLIRRDGSEEHRVQEVEAFQQGGHWFVKIPMESTPDWERVGMDVVAATSNGSVVTAFTVREIDSVRVEVPPGLVDDPTRFPPSHLPVRRYRLYRD